MFSKSTMIGFSISVDLALIVVSKIPNIFMYLGITLQQKPIIVVLKQFKAPVVGRKSFHAPNLGLVRISNLYNDKT